MFFFREENISVNKKVVNFRLMAEANFLLNFMIYFSKQDKNPPATFRGFSSISSSKVRQMYCFFLHARIRDQTVYRVRI